MRWAQAAVRLGASLPRSRPVFGIGVTFQQLFFIHRPNVVLPRTKARSLKTAASATLAIKIK